MDVVKQWTLNICLTLIGAVILSLVSPRGSMGRFYKTVLSLFIIAGFLLPITGGEKADFSAYFSDVTAQAADANSVYESQIESRVKQTLTAAGYKDCSVQASVRIKDQEIYIQKLVVSVPGDMDREAVAALLKAQLGLQPVVKRTGGVEMTEKWKELLKAPQGQRKVFILLAVLGIALVLLSGNGTAGSKSKSETTTARDYDAYVADLEGRLQKTVASMDGVGTCKVMITLEKSDENVYATNSESKRDADSGSSKEDYVLYDQDSGESPLLLSAYLPNVQGVAVVCTGGDDPAVREKITTTVASLFGIPTNRISVSKLKGE